MELRYKPQFKRDYLTIRNLKVKSLTCRSLKTNNESGKYFTDWTTYQIGKI